MNTLMQRAAPGLALATVTLGAVWWGDPAFDPAAEGAATGAAEQSAGQPDSSGSSSDGSGGNSQDPGSDPGGSGSSTESGTSADASSCESASVEAGEPSFTQWGPVQVELEVAPDGTICAAQAIAYPHSDRRSSLINSSAIPYLNAAAVAEGVSFDAVSGATYTSEAYRESMQSILDRL
jgi:uncharacterized protein with FMN-binding domain